jgi:hypothetical protein
MTPAFTSSSLKRPISASIFSLGITPASEFFVARTITMTRIAAPPSASTNGGPRSAPACFVHGDEPRKPQPAKAHLSMKNEHGEPFCGPIA